MDKRNKKKLGEGVRKKLGEYNCNAYYHEKN